MFYSIIQRRDRDQSIQDERDAELEAARREADSFSFGLRHKLTNTRLEIEMGTRADFYVGKGKDAEWIGSIAWDGYPDAIDKQILNCTSAAAFKHAVQTFLDGRDDATLPADGWPWPWDDSRTTDYSYAFFDDSTKASCFGHEWHDPLKTADIEDDLERDEAQGYNEQKMEDFPDMKDKKKVTLGTRSGVIVIGA